MTTENSDAAEREEDMKELIGLFEMMKRDAKGIAADLEDGLKTWRTLSLSAAAMVLFPLALLGYFLVSYFSVKNPLDWVVVGALVGWTVQLLVIVIRAGRKYAQINRKYSGLFLKAKKLD
jgi:hypothetical protein